MSTEAALRQPRRKRAAFRILPGSFTKGDNGEAGASAISHELSGRVIDAIRRPLILLDEKLRVTFANRAFYRTFAVTAEETIGQHLTAAGDHRLDGSALHGFFDLLQGGDAAIEDYEIEIESLALGRRVLLLNGEKIHGETETACEIVVTIDDVTERERLETALRGAKWHAERTNLAKSRFLAAASHDLRQPLQTLSLVRGILTRKIKDNKDALELVARLDETAGSLARMLDALLDINQLEAGNIQTEKVDFPVNDLLERLRIEFAYHAQAHGLTWHVVPCRLNILSDPRLLEQMIRNLLSNAVKYTERGKILLGCRRRGDKLRIEVWDTGAGIPEGQTDAIFTEFHQLDNPAHERSRGLGLGLSIVQRLADLLGHSVDVRSCPGKGSAFAVEAPLGHEQPGALLQRPQWGTAQKAGGDAAILIVEDDPSVREMLNLLFASEGYRTADAAGGKQALALARGAIRPDLVVTDYDLPDGLNGLHVVSGVREAVGREIPAVVLTGGISADTMREIARRGCVQRNKPVSSDELMHLVQFLLAESRRSTDRAGLLPQAGLKGEMLRPTIFVVDDEASVREAMRALLQEEGWLVEVYSSGEAFLEACRAGCEGCLVIDARMPRMSGLELLERLKIEGGPPAIMITGHADIRLAVRAMKAGAMAFLEKPVQYDELIVNIKRALELSRNSAALSSLREAAARRIAGLTLRERQVVEMVVEGNPNKQIAYVLGISQRTVETHRATAMKKIGARTLSELIHLTIAGSPHDT
jgi:two-component system, chemotaxis family, CheB/CheR fusion protein